MKVLALAIVSILALSAQGGFVKDRLNETPEVDLSVEMIDEALESFLHQNYSMSQVRQMIDQLLSGLEWTYRWPDSRVDCVVTIENVSVNIEQGVQNWNGSDKFGSYLNISHEIKGITSAVTGCYKFGNDVKTAVTQWWGMFGGVENYITELVGHIGGSGFVLSNLIKEIKADIANKNYTDLAYCIGKMASIVLYVEPASGIPVSHPAFMRKAGIFVPDHRFEDFVDTTPYSSDFYFEFLNLTTSLIDGVRVIDDLTNVKTCNQSLYSMDLNGRQIKQLLATANRTSDQNFQIVMLVFEYFNLPYDLPYYCSKAGIDIGNKFKSVTTDGKSYGWRVLFNFQNTLADAIRMGKAIKNKEEGVVGTSAKMIGDMVY